LEIFLHLQAVIRPFFRENIILPTITHISLRAPPFYHIPNS
jgi:hypothetical protein